MVRKPDLVPVPLSQAMHNPPYPTTPPDEQPPPLSSPYDASAYQFVSHEDARPTRSRSNSSADEPSDWEAYSDSEEDVPPPLKVGAGKRPSSIAANKDATLPAPLRIGPPSGSPVPRISVEDEDRPNLPKVKTPEPDAKKDEVTKQDESPKINESPRRDELPRINESPSSQRRPTIPLQSQNPYLRLQTTGQSSGAEEREPFWDGSAASAVQQEPVEMPLDNSNPVDAFSKISIGAQHFPKEEPHLLDAPVGEQHEDEHQVVDASPKSAALDNRSETTTKEIPTEAALEARAAPLVAPISERGEPPALPPRRAQDDGILPPKLSRPQEATSNAGTSRQDKDPYQIAHIQLYDPVLREIPILTQKNNGPCSLLALVNALILKTPSGKKTPLTETLGSRTEISLHLLLGAVIDELTSDMDKEYPDVGELFTFLNKLHDGMNVNPRLVAPSCAKQAGDFEQTRELRLYSTFGIPLIHGWLPRPDSREQAAFDRVAKTYEEAQDLLFREEELLTKLTSTGLSKEEQGLFEDLLVIKDFLLYDHKTQLTEYGLEVMRDALVSDKNESSASEHQAPHVAIMFRNDHFSTVINQMGNEDPKTGQNTGRIISLVTDFGYHQQYKDVVWESLVDVKGTNSELLNGKYEAASLKETREPPIGSLLDDTSVTDNGHWQNIQHRKHHAGGAGNTYTSIGTTSSQKSGTLDSGGQPKSSHTEQEDADLALALQLQEEEEDRHRRETEARRRRENELSQSFLGNEASRNNPRSVSNPNPSRIVDTVRNNGIRPLIPPRRSGPQQVQTTHRPADEGDDAPPPTYEQAQNSPVYNPASGLPNPPNNPTSARHGRGQSAYASTSQSYYIGGEGRGSARGRGAATAGRGRGRRQTTGTGTGTGPGSRLIDRIPDGHGTRVQAGEVGEGKDKCCVM